MDNITTSMNLLKLKTVRKMITGKSGQIDCIVIPIEANNLHIAQNGIYLELQHFEYEPKDGSKTTHLVKQKFPKEVYEKMTDEQKREKPILGDSVHWTGGFNDTPPPPPAEEADDLPF